MKSMTGFGTGTAPLDEGQLSVELRALNHRHQDVRVRLPADLIEHVSFVEYLARTRLGRGRYDVNVRISGTATQKPRLCIDRVRALYHSMCELRDELAPGEALPLAAVLGLPHVVETQALEAEAVRTAATRAFEEACSRLEAMRQTEGRALTEELTGRLERVRQLRSRLMEGADALVEHQRARLQERVARLLQGVEASLDPARLEAELALLADKSDITEELVRLGSHFDQLATLFASDQSVGRKLDFLLQEVGREVNTIGSKCPSAEVSFLVVELKAEVERMREQVQNVD